MIRATALHFQYPPRHTHEQPIQVLDGLDLALDPRESMVIMGPTGAGKSTLAHVLAGLAPRYTGGTLSGALQVAHQDLMLHPPEPGMIGILFQDAATQLFNTSVEDEIAWGLEALGWQAERITGAVEEALSRFGLRTLRRRPPWALSVGQQKRLALAAVWAMQPTVLILDEPLSGLDPQGRQEVDAVMTSLQSGGATTVIMSSRPQVAQRVQRGGLLSDGALSLSFTGETVHQHLDRLVEAGVCLPTSQWPDLSPQHPWRSDPPAVEIQDLHFRYEREEVLQGITLQIPSGQFIAIVGHNGAGKSTLARHLNGLLRPQRGKIHILGRPTHGRSTGEIARDVGFLFQRPERQLFAPTVYEEVAYGVRQLTLPGAEARVQDALEAFGLKEVAELPPALLGWGLQRSVTLASLAALETPIVVLDEPTVGLDGRGMAQLLNWLTRLRREGRTIILITHELPLAARADRAIVLAQGRIIADGPPSQALPRLWEGENA